MRGQGIVLSCLSSARPFRTRAHLCRSGSTRDNRTQLPSATAEVSTDFLNVFLKVAKFSLDLADVLLDISLKFKVLVPTTAPVTSLTLAFASS